MADDGGVLGNLPNSRPGKRSAKRESGGTPAKSAGEAATRAEAAGKPAAKAPRTPKAARTSAKPGAKAAGRASPAGPAGKRRAATRPERLAPEPSGDPVTAAVRTAAGLAVTSARVAGAVTRELLRRLPRP